MKTADFAVLLMVLGALAVWTVREQGRSVALGYEEGRLRSEREQLRRANSELRYQRARLSSPDRLERVAAQYGLGLVERGKAGPLPATRGATHSTSPRRTSPGASSGSGGRSTLARRGGGR